jgi:hypothetical protein
MAMTSIEIRKSKSERFWSVAGPSLGIAVLAFAASVYVGLLVVAVVVACAVVFSGDLKQFVSNQPVVLVLDEAGVGIKRGHFSNIVIPWQNIEELGLSHGRGGATMLTIRVREPEKYLNRFMRANLVLSRFHISVAISGLEYCPREVVQKIEAGREAHA